MTSFPTEAELAANLAHIEAALAEACAAADRPRASVRLLAVSKEQPAASVAALNRLGLSDFGENRVQALHQRCLELHMLQGLSWHLIGPIQTNKARDINRLAPAMLHTIDRPALVDALAQRWEHPAPLPVLIQVNIDAEPQKAGCLPDALDALADCVTASRKLVLKGLMAIPAPLGETSLRHAFARMRALSDVIADRVDGPVELSMGMSDDFAWAIAEGATIVRIGTALFGARQPA